MSQRSLSAPGDLLTESSTSTGGSNPRSTVKKRSAQTVVPPLPGHKSTAERVAQGKNSVLHRRLQSCLKDIARDRRTLLLQNHVEAAKFKRRVIDLNNRVRDSLKVSAPCRNLKSAGAVSSISSPPTNTTTITRPGVRRPVTSLGSRREDTRGVIVRSDHGRPSTSISWQAHHIRGKPLFKVRANRIKTSSSSSSTEDDADCDEDLYFSDDSDSFVEGKDKPSRNVNSVSELKPSKTLYASKSVRSQSASIYRTEHATTAKKRVQDTHTLKKTCTNQRTPPSTKTSKTQIKENCSVRERASPPTRRPQYYPTYPNHRSMSSLGRVVNGDHGDASFSPISPRAEDSVTPIARTTKAGTRDFRRAVSSLGRADDNGDREDAYFNLISPRVEDSVTPKARTTKAGTRDFRRAVSSLGRVDDKEDHRDAYFNLISPLGEDSVTPRAHTAKAGTRDFRRAVSSLGRDDDKGDHRDAYFNLISPCVENSVIPRAQTAKAGTRDFRRAVSSLGRADDNGDRGDAYFNLISPLGEDSVTPRTQTAKAGTRDFRRAVSSPAGDRVNDRDPDYLRLVLNLERNKYEISQMKVKTYLQNLKL